MADRTDDQRAFAESVRQFARERLAPAALRRAHEPGYAWDAAKLLADQGLLGLTLAEADGGQGASLMDAVIALQEVSKACPKSGDVVQAGNFGAIRTFAEYAPPELKERHLPELLGGRGVLALGMSEPEAGSAVTELRTTAVRENGKVRINGTKVFSTNSPDATVFLVYVRFGPGTDGIGSVIVERDAPGFRLGQPSAFMNGEQWCQLYFEDCVIPDGNVVLGAGGFRKQIQAFNVERLGNASRALALGQLAFETARDHAKTREQFGRRLCEFQGLQWKFAEMAMALDGAQMMLDRAAQHASAGLPDAYETTVAKLAANLAGFQAADQAMQIMGGTGYSQESLVEYCFRRTRGWMIAGGSIEMLKNRIAETVFERRFDQRPPRTAK